MIQFNLLPDVKLAYIKAKRTKYLVLMTAVIAAGVSLTILILLVVAVDVLQKKYLSDINKDIKSYSKELNDNKDLSKILTIQNQLKSLPGLYDSSAVTSRLYPYLAQIIPAQITMTNLDVNFDLNTIEFSGKGDTLDRVNIFADTLKFTTFTTQKDPKGSNKAFTGVVLTSFSRADKNATYTINASFDKAIFDSKEIVALTVPPSKITTRSQTDQPSANYFETPDTTNQTAP